MSISHCEDNDSDRISNLPDELLHHVMSYLTAQEAVRTCVLSRRWQNVWSSMMFLHANAAKSSSITSFKKFLDNVLLYRNPVPLKGLWVSAACDNSDDSLDYSDIHRWVHHVLRSNAREVGIFVRCGSKLLSIDGYPFAFTSVHLSKLVLFKFTVNDCFAKKLSSGCPVLKDLVLISCGIDVTMFSSTTLKSFVIHNAEDIEHLPKQIEYLVIEMPNLVTLHIEEIPRRNIHLVDLSSVKEATIYFFEHSFRNSAVDCNILSALSNATSLKLICDSVYDELGAEEYEKFPTAAAAIDPPCKEAARTFHCEKLTEIEIVYPQGDKRVHIILLDSMSLIEQVLPATGMTTSINEENAPDRISRLPDGLLRFVMLYLTAQEAVQTCVLSRRWQNVWSSTKWLKADAAKFSSMKSFKKFVDNLLLYRRPVPLDALFILATCNHSDDSLDYSDIHSWIRHALRSNAWALGIMEHCGTNLLSIDGYPFPFTSVYLSILHLCHFIIDDSFVKKLSSCCPVLEDLELKNCAIIVTMFSSTTLKNLLINSTETTEHFPPKFEHLMIDMPNLVTLHLDEIPNRNIQLVDVSSVKRATFYFFELSFQNSAVDCNIIPALSNVTSLELVSPTAYEDVVPNVLIRSFPRCKTFSNLKYLKLGEWFLRDGCYPLLFLLRRSPNIEKLHLQLNKYGSDDYEDYPDAAAAIDPTCREIEEMFNCVKLRKITIFYPQGDERVHIIVRILIANISPLPAIKIKPTPVVWILVAEA
uniref:F-box domain-containing protein n=1 Tax=Oryza glumipatula TaxID=40148 RepID=A0A0E0AQS8_9ORYZ